MAGYLFAGGDPSMRPSDRRRPLAWSITRLLANVYSLARPPADYLRSFQMLKTPLVDVVYESMMWLCRACYSSIVLLLNCGYQQLAFGPCAAEAKNWRFYVVR